jgi:hypothetical protein
MNGHVALGGLTMPVQDWTRVDAGVWHDFHVAWIPEIRTVLNSGLLPPGYYALAEQHAGRSIADVLTLHASPVRSEPLPLPPDTGGTAVAEVPPRVRRRQTVEQAALVRRRSLAIRHVSDHRLIALIEIVSPANKDRARHVEDFAAKAAEALELGVPVCGSPPAAGRPLAPRTPARRGTRLRTCPRSRWPDPSSRARPASGR